LLEDGGVAHETRAQVKIAVVLADWHQDRTCTHIVSPPLRTTGLRRVAEDATKRREHQPHMHVSWLLMLNVRSSSSLAIQRVCCLGEGAVSGSCRGLQQATWWESQHRRLILHMALITVVSPAWRMYLSEKPSYVCTPDASAHHDDAVGAVSVP